MYPDVKQSGNIRGSGAGAKMSPGLDFHFFQFVAHALELDGGADAVH